MRKTLSMLLLIGLAFAGFINQTDSARSLNYSFASSKSVVYAGESFDVSLKLTNNTALPFYDVSVYLYQGHQIDECSVVSATPSYNATYSDPKLSAVYNPGYWTRSSVSAAQSATFKVTYNVNSSVSEGPLKTLGYDPITRGTDPSSAEQNKVSEMLVDVTYYVDNSGLDSAKRTIRGYVDLPSAVQPAAAISAKTLPKVFRAGPDTTDVSQIKQNEAEEYKNFTLDTAVGNKIIWREAVNLADATLLSRIENIDTYVFISAPGLISVDTTMAPFFDVGAQIVFKNVSFLMAPKLLKDGQEVSEDIQTTGSCDLNSKTCSFLVDGFSEYKFKPTITLEIPEVVPEAQYTVEGTIDDLDAVIEIKLNDNDWKEVGEVDIGTGTFRSVIVLAEGANIIKVRATSKNSEEALVTFTSTVGEVEAADESDTGTTDEKAPNVMLRILGVALILVAVITAGVMWWIIYKRKKEKKIEKAAQLPKDIVTRIVSKDKPVLKKLESKGRAPSQKK